MNPDSKPSQKPPSNQQLIPPDNNLVWAILATVLCCIPLCIYAIICSNKVNTLWIQGDYKGAEKAANDAKKWSIYSALSIIILFILIFLLYFAILFFSILIMGISNFFPVT